MPFLDLNTISSYDVPSSRADLKPWQDGDAFLGGGTWLFSEQQAKLRRLIDLSGMGWPPLASSSCGLQIASTCTIAQLNAVSFPDLWRAAPLVAQCSRALLASFKIWNAATVGGNICLALPAGSMTSLAVALGGIGTIWMPDGQDRQLAIADLVTGPNQNSLRPGEVLRQVEISSEAMMCRSAFRQSSLTQHGRSGALLIGTRPVLGQGFSLTVTASVRRPVQLHFADVPAASELAGALAAAIPDADYYDDMHGAPDWRQHVTLHHAEGIRRELAADPGA